MAKWKTENLLQATGGTLICGNPAQTFAGIAIDSRTIDAGAFFIAIIGETHDGHGFIDRVLEKGVRGILVNRDKSDSTLKGRVEALGGVCIAVEDTTKALGDIAAWHRNKASVKVVAITGSNGKTTTRKMTTAVVERTLRTVSTMGNFNNEIGLPLSLLALEDSHQAAVLELGMNHPGEIDRLGEICRPDVGIITNVGPAHLEFLGSIEGVARAKGELIHRVKPGGTVVLNADDSRVKALAKETDREILFFGVKDGDAAVRAEKTVESADGTEFLLRTPKGEIPVRLKVPGRVMVYNALAAASVGLLMGVPMEEIKIGLERFEPAKGRMNMIQTKKGIYIIDDTYNANPESMKAALESLSILKGKQRGHFAAGDMLELGQDAARLHEEVGRKAASSGLHAIYATGAFAASVADGAREDHFDGDALFTGTKEEILSALKTELAAGDWLLVKGSRGMTMETIVEAIREWADTENEANA